MLVMWILRTLSFFSAVIITLTLVGCSGYYMTQLINTPVHITKEWSEFVPPQPLRCDLNDQEILVEVATPHETETKGWGVVLRDGSVANPEVRMLDTAGTQYNLDERSFWGPAMCFRGRALPNHRDFAKVLIRSDAPVDVSKITWNCYNFQDHKR
jgi:hypothetical protein